MADAKEDWSDDELLRIVGDERQRSIGFEHDSVLLKDRQKALEYFKGEMRDVPSLANRSKAVSTDVADAIETLTADLVPIFTEGDDVVEFKPQNQADEDQAKLESDYVAWVVFEQNPGFMVLSSMFKDALLVKTGVVKWWWEDPPKPKSEVREGVPEMQAVAALAMRQAKSATPSEATDESGETQGEQTFDLTMQPQEMPGRVRIKSWPPEDFTVAADTVWLQEATYCAARSRPRAQDLQILGIDQDLIEKLPPYGENTDQLQISRDTAGEYQSRYGSTAYNPLRQVEVVEHFIRLVDDDGEPHLWRVMTGGDESVLLEREEVDHLPFAAITPYVVTHRFYGESVADKLMEVARIKTALTRGGLDSIYFALNQRMGVATTGANEFTISDLLDNRPGMPVRMEREGAVFPLTSAGVNFGEFAQGLEYFSTVSEQRTGITRNAQGLNPDTLHDTATGAALMNAMSNKRTRFIARVFAETGVKDIFLGVHRLLRQHAKTAQPAKKGGQWLTPSPREWAQRHDVTVDVGVGSGDRAQTLQTLSQVLEFQAKVAELPGGMALVKPENAYAALTDFVSKSGSKKGPLYFSDPTPQPDQPPMQPPPNPDLMKVQQQQAAMQSQQQLDAAKLQQSGQAQQLTAQTEAQKLALAQQVHADTMALEHRKLDLEQQRIMVMAHTKQADTQARVQGDDARTHMDAGVKLHGIETQAHTALTVASMNDATKRDEINADLAIQASQQHDAEVMDD